METPSAIYAAIQITYPGGGKEMRVGFNLPSEKRDAAECVYRSYTGSLPNAWTSMSEGPCVNAETFA